MGGCSEWRGGRRSTVERQRNGGPAPNTRRCSPVGVLCSSLAKFSVGLRLGRALGTVVGSIGSSSPISIPSVRSVRLYTRRRRFFPSGCALDERSELSVRPC